MLRMAVEEEVRVGRQVVLADARADERRVGERRKAPAEVLACEPFALRIRQPLQRVGVDLGARPVPRDLESEPAELTVPVVRPRVVAERRPAGPGAVDAGEIGRASCRERV